MKLPIKIFITFLLTFQFNTLLCAQFKPIQFGTEIALNQLNHNSGKKGKPINWIDVNTSPETWRKDKDLLINGNKEINTIKVRVTSYKGNVIIETICAISSCIYSSLKA